MTTMRQAEANRRNSAHSTGPKTVEGKDRVRRNALKHGFLSQEVMPQELGEKLAERISDFEGSVTIENKIQAYQIRQAALASVKVESCQADDLVRRIELAEIASDPGRDWEDERQDEANRLGESLKRNPVRVSHQLKRTPAGRNWLIGQWRMLMNVLRGGVEGVLWNETHTNTALDLLGSPPRELANMQAFRDSFNDSEIVLNMIESEMTALFAKQENAPEENAYLRELHRHGLRLYEDRTLKLIDRYETKAKREYRIAMQAFEVPRSGAPRTSAPAKEPVSESQAASVTSPPAPPSQPAEPAAPAEPVVEELSEHRKVFRAYIEAMYKTAADEFEGQDTPQCDDEGELSLPTGPAPTPELREDATSLKPQVSPGQEVRLSRQQRRKLRRARSCASY